jgi:hypothetical protein
MKFGRILLIAACLIAVGIVVFQLTLSSAAPVNTYCGNWGEVQVSAGNLWKTVGNWEYYVGFSFSGDEYSCIGVFDKRTNTWALSKLCKFGDLRQCNPSELTSITYMFNYPSCPAGSQSNGDGCSAGCTYPNYVENGYCVPATTLRIFAQGDNVPIEWNFLSVYETSLYTANFVSANIYVRDSAGKIVYNAQVTEPHGVLQFHLASNAAMLTYTIEYFADYTDDVNVNAVGSAYEQVSRISSFYVIVGAQSPAGGACNVTSNCQSGLICTNGNACSSTGKTGNSCSSSVQCNQGLLCTNGDVCSSSGNVSNSCTSTGQCAQGLVCQNGQCIDTTPSLHFACSSYACSPVSSSGANMCNFDNECKSPINGTCTSSSNCQLGLACSNNICIITTTQICQSFTYTNWNACNNATQKRTVTGSNPAGCVGGTPILTQSCLGNINDICSNNMECILQSCVNNRCTNPVTPTQTCTSFNYTAVSSCVNGNQALAVTGASPLGCVGGNPATSQTCLGNINDICSSNSACLSGFCAANNTCQISPTLTQTCTSFDYNVWTACSFGLQNRTVMNAYPAGCTDGNPTLTQTCVGDLGNNCNSDNQCSSNLVCANNVCSSPTIICTSFAYTNWNACNNGTQARSVTGASPLGCTGGSPILTQSCTGNIGDVCNTNSICLSNYCAPDFTCQINPTLQCNVDSDCSLGFSCILGNCVDITPPAAVTTPSTSPTNDSVFLTWTNPSDPDFSHVEIYLNDVNIANTTLSSYTITGLAPNTTYNISLYTVDIYNNVNTSFMNITVTTQANPSPGNDTIPPSTITNLYLASLGKTYFTLAWTNPTDGDFAYSLVYMNGILMQNSSSNSFSASALTADTDYTISIYTVDTSGNVNASAVSYAVTTLQDTSGGGTGGGKGARGIGVYNRAVSSGIQEEPFIEGNEGAGIIDLTEQKAKTYWNIPVMATWTAIVLALLVLIALIVYLTKPGRQKQAVVQQ